MSIAFSSEDSEPINRKIEDQNNDKRNENITLDEMYEIDKCVQWILTHKFTKIALQFPDSYLVDSTFVALKIEDSTKQKIFILGDTSYGSCCVDEVAAEHVLADAIIHFGHACLSPTKRLPVLYVFGKQLIDVTDAAFSFKNFFPDSSSLVVVLYEVAYLYVIGEFIKYINEYKNVVISKLEIPGEDCEISNEIDNNLVKITKNHRHLFLSESHTISDYSMFYIGSRVATMTNFMLTFSNCHFYSYNPFLKTCKAETLHTNKYLKKRYYYIEKAKDANIIGILVGTLGVTNYLNTINHLRKLIKSAGKKSYVLVVGKLNNAKLANFAEIDIFVNVACIESSIIDCKDFYQPIVTPYELEISLNQARQWSQEYLLDFSDILPGAVTHVPLCEKPLETDVSLVTGKLRYTGLSSDERTTEISETAVVVRDSMEISSVHAQGAGEFLLQRSWKGLEQKLGETPYAEIEEGQRGIASQYEDEKTNI